MFIIQMAPPLSHGLRFDDDGFVILEVVQC